MDFWTAVLFSIAIATLFNILINMLLKKQDRKVIMSCLFFGLETFCNQSGSPELKNTSFRILSISLSIVVIFAISSYGSMITTFFAVKFWEIPFSNLKEFLGRKQYRLVIDKTDFNQLQQFFYPISKWLHDVDTNLVRLTY